MKELKKSKHLKISDYHLITTLLIMFLIDAYLTLALNFKQQVVKLLMKLKNLQNSKSMDLSHLIYLQK